MSDHRIEKPNLFISHATSDGQFATVLKGEIDKVFADGINVFCTSSAGAISASTDWLSNIEQRLDIAQAVIVLVTPLSIERSWLWFEVGASWSRARKGHVAIYPLCAPEIDFGDLPSPLDRLQALSMGKAIDLKLLFEGLIKQFGFGKISSFKAANIQKRIPKYNTVRMSDEDRASRSLYNGRYAGYSDDELCQVLVTSFLQPEYADRLSYRGTYKTGREDSIYNGKLLHFRDIEKKYDLPPGTARRLLLKLAPSFLLETQLLTDNLVRFVGTEEWQKKHLQKDG